MTYKLIKTDLPDHNGMNGLQGGAVGDYQHLTTAQLGSINSIPTNTFSIKDGIIVQNDLLLNGTAEFLFLQGQSSGTNYGVYINHQAHTSAIKMIQVFIKCKGYNKFGHSINTTRGIIDSTGNGEVAPIEIFTTGGSDSYGISTVFIDNTATKNYSCSIGINRRATDGYVIHDGGGITYNDYHVVNSIYDPGYIFISVGGGDNVSGSAVSNYINECTFLIYY